MHSRMTFGEIVLPSYSVCIILGILIANIAAFVVAKRRKICFETLFLLEVFGGIGAVIGAKLWFQIETNGWTDLSIETVMSGGWSSYGGLVIGILTIILVCKWNHFDREIYEKNFVFLVPLVHMFWKIGCYMAGCCYGIAYDGIFAVTFPETGVAPHDVSLFPVQLLEAILLAGLVILFYIKGKKDSFRSPITEYIVCYGIIRFVVEFFRYREDRWILSVPQGIAVLAVLLGVGFLKGKEVLRKQGGRDCE